jgi:hypothetical protein
MILSLESFLRKFNFSRKDLPKEALEYFRRMNTNYRALSREECKEHVLEVLRKINSPFIARNEMENLKVFEKGWSENLRIIRDRGINPENLKPKYFRPKKFLRYNQDIVVAQNTDLEYGLFTIARYVIFQKYLSGFDRIYEIGCGSCQNLYLLSELFPEKDIFGMDFTNASVKIGDYIAFKMNKKIKVTTLNMLRPNTAKKMLPQSAVITIHALEQLGSNFKKIFSYILDSKPGIVIHLEPILELYEQDNLYDYLALLYSQKRNYLNGYFTFLKELEKQRKIKILAARRSYFGGNMHEGNSLIVWKPVINK